MAVSTLPYFSPATFRFLRGLARNNNRGWFLAHKAEYENHVRTPALRLIADLAQPLKAISPQLIANPKAVGGSLFRIHRDTRFSSDPTPYKIHIGINFYHAATRAVPRGTTGTAAMGRLDAPLLYLHVEPGASFMGGGIWHPQAPTLKRLRDFMVDNPVSWKEASRDRRFRRRFRLAGEALSRPPRGYPAAHELIDDLKRKDYIGHAPLADEMLLRPDLSRVLVRHYIVMRPLLDWLSAALELEF